MSCRGCRGNRNIRTANSRGTITNDIESPIVYVLCRNCGLMRAMRSNLATHYVRLVCEACNHKVFHALKQPPTPEMLKKLIIQR